MLNNIKMLIRSFYLLITLIVKPPSTSDVIKKNRIIIYGWYGTETLGDKLILLGILKKLVHKKRTVQICSIDPNFTKSTLLELTDLAFVSDANFIIENVEIVSEQSLLRVNKTDTLVLGGGPLMDDPRLLFWALINIIAKMRGATRVIWGCGVGPVRMKFCSLLIGKLLSLQNAVVLRPSHDLEHKMQFIKYDLALCPSFLCQSELQEYVKEDHVQRGVAINLRFLPRLRTIDLFLQAW